MIQDADHGVDFMISLAWPTFASTFIATSCLAYRTLQLMMISNVIVLFVECTELHRLTMDDGYFFVNTSGIPCFSCDLTGQITYFIDTDRVVLSGIGDMGGVFMINNNNELVILNPEVEVPVGDLELLIDCGGLDGFIRGSISSNGKCFPVYIQSPLPKFNPAAYLPPNINPTPPIILDEGDSMNIFCGGTSHRNLRDILAWSGPIGVQNDPNEIILFFNTIQIISARRHHAGEYVCTDVALDGRTTSNSTLLIVNCELESEAEL